MALRLWTIRFGDSSLTEIEVQATTARGAIHRACIKKYDTFRERHPDKITKVELLGEADF